MQAHFMDSIRISLAGTLPPKVPALAVPHCLTATITSPYCPRIDMATALETVPKFPTCASKNGICKRSV